MQLSQLIAFNAALLAAVISPGPALLYALKTSLGNGRRAGINAGLGLATMAATWTLLALFGLDRIFQAFPAAYTTIKIVGALYLLFIAWSMWRGADSPIDRQDGPDHRVLLSGLLVNAANPKSVLFAAAVLVVVFPTALSPAQMAAVTLNHFFVEIAIYFSLAIFLNSPPVAQRYLSAKPFLDRSCAAVLSALGIRLLFERD